MKKILFLSALDFKEKSIQVIKKTPEAYAESGWHVDCVVARDTSPAGNYYYEDEVDPQGCKVFRFNWPFPSLREGNRYLTLLFAKIATIIVIFRLAAKGFFLLRKERYDVVYGYEMHGVLATNLLKIFFPRRCYISRFQGVFYIKEHLEKRRVLSLIFNADHLLALWLPSDLCIMTNDGTKGDWVLEKIRSRSQSKLMFLPNGVDWRRELSCNYDLNSYAVMTSRLVKIKRVNLAIIAVHRFIEAYGTLPFKKVIVIGAGPEEIVLKSMARDLRVSSFFDFKGAVKNDRTRELVQNSSFALSLYESSNIGNPFFESMSVGVPFVCVNNGDTSKFVLSNVNGYLLDEDDVVGSLVNFFILLKNGKIDLVNLHKGATSYANRYVSTWPERMQNEIDKVEYMLYKRLSLK